MNDTPDFAKLLALLTREKVKFIVCGGVAIGFNGFVRTTEDLDIVIELSAGNVHNLSTALASFGEGYGAGVTLEDFPMEPGAVRIAEQDCPLDIFVEMSGRTYGDLFPDTVEAKVGNPGFKIRHLNRKALWMLKKDSFRAKDRIDAEKMEELEKEENKKR